ncbi:response regulator transcription factor [Paraburkholderia susongensis]|uniref:Two component transcriptional regulator, LuxR family n=1 Tax=Paraburkholderia susongensis TaxID=1515439 RepID=A0A1X7LS97_9BURK|nr:response regulator transcription factor [Paraburkholderia susongensis]SMG56357.1 two component transcriptional regulator, LuxR family [Paraburkholderia susongensis]
MASLTIRVLLADDHPAMLRGVEHELSVVSSIQLMGSAHSSTELIAFLNTTPCDVVVSDYAMPAGEYGDGIALFSLIQRRYPSVKLVVLTMLDNPAVLRALVMQGISCIVSKSDAVSHIVPAVHTANSGGKYYSPRVDEIVQSIDWNRRGRGSTDVLSQRESEVVRLFASGLTVNEIADRLCRSKKTISSQKSKAMEKLGIDRDVDLLRYAMENGMVSSSERASNGESDVRLPEGGVPPLP